MPGKRSLLLGLHITIMLVMISCSSTSSSKSAPNLLDLVRASNDSFYLDERIWYQDIKADMENGAIVLRGEAFFKQPVRGLERRIRKAGFEQDIIDSISYLPQEFAPDQAYAVVTVPYVMGRYKPVDHKQEGTEMLYGEPVRLIRELPGYVQVQSATGYLGYVPKSSLRRMPLELWTQYQKGPQAVFTTNHELNQDLTLFRGTRLPILEDGTDAVIRQTVLRREGLPRGPIVPAHTTSGTEPQDPILILEDGRNAITPQAVFGHKIVAKRTIHRLV